MNFRSHRGVPMLRDGVPIGVDRRRPRGGADRSPTVRSRSSRPSPTRPSSPSRTSACSRSSRPQPRPHRDPRAADGDGRDPARHLELADRRPARLRHDRRRAPSGCATRSSARRLPLRRRPAPLRRPPRAARPEGVEAVGAPFPMAPAEAAAAARAILSGVVDHVPDVAGGSRLPVSASVARTADFRSMLAVPMVREGQSDRRHHRRRARRPDRSPTARSSCSRPSPTRPSSPSRTSGCSRSWRPATATSPRPSSSRPRRARSCASSPARRPTSSPSSTRSPRAPRGSATRSSARVFALRRRPHPACVAHHGSRRDGDRGRRARLPAARRAGHAAPAARSWAARSSTSRTSRPTPTTGPSDMARRAGYRSMLAVPMLREGAADRRHHGRPRARPGPSPTGRSSS